MGTVEDIRKAGEVTEIQPANLEDAIEFIKALRTTVDEQQDYIDVLEDQSKIDEESGMRERLVMTILPSMISLFDKDLGGDVSNADYARLIIAGGTVKLADAVLREMRGN